MRALPARRFALGACCAALLVGITGPAATAADAVRERTRVMSSGAPLAQVGDLDAREAGLAPVVALLKAALEAEGGQLPPGEAGRLGEAAKDALEAEAAKTQEPTAEQTTVPATPAAPDPVADTLPADEGTEPGSDPLDAVHDAVDSLLDLLLSDDEADAAQVPASVDTLLTKVDDLVDALTGTESQVSILPAPATAPQTQVPLLPAVTIPALEPLTPLLLPTS